MIVQCDQCNAKFKLDDSKIRDGGVKVRCSKCKHVFVVQKEAPVEETDFDSILSGLDTTPATSIAAPAMEPTPSHSAQAPQENETFKGFEAHGEQSSQEKTVTDLGEGFSPVASQPTEWGEVPSQEEMPQPENPLAGDVFAAREESAAEGGEFPFGEFSFEEPEVSAPAGVKQAFSSYAQTQETSAAPEQSFEAAQEESFPAFDEFDATHGTDNRGETEKVAVQAEEFSFPDDFFAEKKGVESVPQSEPTYPAGQSESAPAASPVAPEGESVEEKAAGESESFDFGAFDFGVATPEEPVISEQREEPRNGAETANAFFAAALESPSPVFEVPSPPTAEEPLTVAGAARRRGSQSLPLTVLALSIIFVLVLVGGGYYFFTQGPSALNKLDLGILAKWAGIETAEEGNISLKNLAGAYIVNHDAGEIFVVSGEAVNNFKKPRASIQVKATLLGSKGEVLHQKIAYAGNSLSNEQLGNLPLERIEERMNNQFGDSLANLGVQSGKSIPFVVVFANVPKEAVDYAVEVAGSTVAGQQ